MRKLMNAFVLGLAIPTLLSATTETALAQSGIKSERVSFRPGQSSTIISRAIRGRETIDFLVNVREGQRLAVSMTSNNDAANFNLIAPGERDVAFYVGSNSSPSNVYNGRVPKSGDLKIRVYLYRAAAMNGERANIRLSLTVSGAGGATQLPGTAPGNGAVAGQLPGDALVPGTQYNATGRLSCMARLGGRTTDCQYGVIRLGDGSAAVTITKIDGRTRTLIYRRGTPVGFDQGPSDPVRFTWTREGYVTRVQIGGERYYVPDSIVTGG